MHTFRILDFSWKRSGFIGLHFCMAAKSLNWVATTSLGWVRSSPVFHYLQHFRLYLDTEIQLLFTIIFQYCFMCFLELYDASSHLICDYWSERLKRKRKNLITIQEMHTTSSQISCNNFCYTWTNIQLLPLAISTLLPPSSSLGSLFPSISYETLIFLWWTLPTAPALLIPCFLSASVHQIVCSLPPAQCIPTLNNQTGHLKPEWGWRAFILIVQL